MTAGTSLHVLSALALSFMIAPSLWGQESGAGQASELFDIYAAPARRVAAVPLRETPAPNIDGVLEDSAGPSLQAPADSSSERH
jgi:hypothetical protein